MHMTIQTLPGSGAERGSVLLEALFSILIFSIGILGMIGLQARMVQESIHAQYRTDASFLAGQAVSQSMVGAFAATQWQAEIAAALPNGTGTTTLAGSQLTVAVFWRMPQETAPHNFTVVARVCANPASTNCT
jgi:type IV pilus assembly protein PilV